MAEIMEEISSSEYAIDHRLSRFKRMPAMAITTSRWCLPR